MDCGDPVTNAGDLPIVILGDRNARYGLIVDRFLGERELVVQPLDPRLGKIKDISAAALMEDGSPVLIVDVDDLVRSIEKLASGGALAKVQRGVLDANSRKQKRILAVDDSLTVRELERKLLSGRGYVTDVAVDGMTFHQPVFVGDEVSVFATLETIGRSSMTVATETWRRDRHSDDCCLVTRARFTFVAIGPDRRPRSVRPIATG